MLRSFQNQKNLPNERLYSSKWWIQGFMALLALHLPILISLGETRDHEYLDTLEEVSGIFEKTFPFSQEQRDDWAVFKKEFQTDLATESILSDAVFAEKLNQRFQQLHISHLQIQALNSHAPQLIKFRGRAHSGITMQWIENGWYIQNLDPETAQKMPFVRPGFEITHFDHYDFTEQSATYSIHRIAQCKSAHFGPLNQPYHIQGLDLDGNQFEAQATFIDWKGIWSKEFGNMGSLPVLLDTSTIRGVKVIKFNYFVFEILPEIRAAIESTPPDSGIVFDLRGNLGGMGIMANALAGKLTDTAFRLGEMQLNGGWMAFFADPQPGAFLGKTAILINGFSASTSEIFAQGMKESGRARIFGTPSMGAALPCKFVPIQNRFILQIPVATYVSDQGIVIENHGVIPQETLALSRDDLINQQDPILSKSIDWILQSLPISKTTD